MQAIQPQRRPDADSQVPRSKPHIYTLEATGLLVIALLILVTLLARYWHQIPWSAR